MKVAALITGSELLDGHVTDTNTGHLARELASVGISLSRTMSVRDMQGEISATLAALAGTNDLVVVSGGIGPTDDDVTMNAVALSTGTTVADGIPSCARRLENRAGTADGAHLKIGTADVFVFPGVPLEFEFFVREHLLTFLEGRSSGEVTGSRVIKAFGLGEARINELVGAGISAIDCLKLSYLPVFPEIHLRMSSTGTSDQNTIALDCGEKVIRDALGDAVWGVGDETLPLVLGNRLRLAGLTLALGESCTGGMVSEMVTSAPGSSEYFLLGAVTYSNAAKMAVLGVPGQILDTKGAVSSETVHAMCAGLRRVSGADCVAAVSGIAGPGGGTADKPVGTVHFCVDMTGRMHHEHLVVDRGREKFRKLVSYRLLWQIWKMAGEHKAGKVT